MVAGSYKNYMKDITLTQPKYCYNSTFAGFFITVRIQISNKNFLNVEYFY